MLISFQIRQNEESDGCYEMKAVWWRNWISTNHVRDGNKNTELFTHGEEKWVLVVFRFCNYITGERTTQRFRACYTFGELQSGENFHFETVFLRDIFMHITYVNV